MEKQDDPQQERRRRRPRGWRLALILLALLVVVAVAVVWSVRVQLATRYVESELARRGVRATYEISQVGLRTQVLENLVIGDPRRPDAVIRRVEIGVRIGLTGPQIGLIRARGVRMRGRVVGGRLRLGDIDKLLPPPTGLPFRLPDQDVDVEDAAIALDTPAGQVALGLAGRGNLADGFRGQLAMVSRGLGVGDCRIERPRALVAVGVDDLRPSFRGPLAMRSLRCGNDLAAVRPLFALNATLTPALDGWRGETAMRVARLEAGPPRLSAIEGRLTFRGDLRRTAGRVDIATGPAAADVFRAARTRFVGSYAVSGQGGDLALNGEVGVGGFALRPDAAAGIAGALRAAEGTPFGPIGDALAGAVLRAVRGGGDATAQVRLVNGRGFAALRLGQLRYATASGARFAADGGRGITYYWPSETLRVDGDFALSGGGFPDARFGLRQATPGGAIEGSGRVGAMRAGDARLALDAISFIARPGGVTTFRTALLADGPLGGGRVAGLTLPLSGRFGPDGLALGEGCAPVAFRSLEIDQLRFGPSRLPLCPTGRALVWQARGGPVQAGAELRGPRLAGRLGQSPLLIASDRVRVGLDGFVANSLAMRLGPAAAFNRLDIATLSGRFVPQGVTGAFAGLSGKLASVPLRVDQGDGRWQYLGGDLLMQGGLRLTDAVDPIRFRPMTSDDFRLTLADNRIHANGWFEHPDSGTRITRATVDHDLATGAGAALLDVEGLAFTETFQPDAITPLTIGVVALVNGTVNGQGRIEWDSRGTRSTGTFSTADMDLAAPFGPVEGLSTSIRFTDLLGLTSAPGQVAEMDLVRAGVDVYDGHLTYQIQPNYHVAIESGRWPFAGGELFLQPTVLDFSQPSTKYITFRVVGLDAAAFIQQMEFSNISATGTFDGLIPMEFDIRGGRIVGGRMSARPPGGNLAYIGELTEQDLGAYGNLAFQALKALRYDRFDLSLDGALDGEFLTIIDLDGIARDPEMTSLPSGSGIAEMIAGRVFRQVARIPFEFNIRIQGQFRALIATARSFEDPTPLIQSVLPEMLRNQSINVNDVQNDESEPVQ
ncbi:MAG: intermembrane phospholipid transport protein YdbH family protein [Allosphingosinicella sp.]